LSKSSTTNSPPVLLGGVLWRESKGYHGELTLDSADDIKAAILARVQAEVREVGLGTAGNKVEYHVIDTSAEGKVRVAFEVLP
jgi:hypothetical protein